MRCKQCGLVQQNPQPLKDEVLARYSAAFSKDYLSYELENETAFLNLQLLALKDAGFFKLTPASVLDIGCATGALLAFLAEDGWRVTGIEISSCADYARSKRNLQVRSLPLEENKFSAESFDVILASHLIEHLNEPMGFLKEAYRLLKKDGYIFITTPNISGFQARLFGGKWRSAIFDHLYLFSRRTLIKMLIKAGFRVEKVSTWGGLAVGFAPSWLKKIADMAVKHLGCGDVMIIRAIKK